MSTKNPLNVTPMNAIKSQCHQCMGHYSDGRIDCENVRCSLYPYMPYRKLEPDTTWTKYNPIACGLRERTKREMTDEQKALFMERVHGVPANKG